MSVNQLLGAPDRGLGDFVRMTVEAALQAGPVKVFSVSEIRALEQSGELTPPDQIRSFSAISPDKVRRRR